MKQRQSLAVLGLSFVVMSVLLLAATRTGSSPAPAPLVKEEARAILTNMQVKGSNVVAILEPPGGSPGITTVLAVATGSDGRPQLVGGCSTRCDGVTMFYDRDLGWFYWSWNSRGVIQIWNKTGFKEFLPQ